MESKRSRKQAESRGVCGQLMDNSLSKIQLVFWLCDISKYCLPDKGFSYNEFVLILAIERAVQRRRDWVLGFYLCTSIFFRSAKCYLV